MRFALTCAVVLTVAMSGCSQSSPATVDDVDRIVTDRNQELVDTIIAPGFSSLNGKIQAQQTQINGIASTTSQIEEAQKNQVTKDWMAEKAGSILEGLEPHFAMECQQSAKLDQALEKLDKPSASLGLGSIDSSLTPPDLSGAETEDEIGAWVKKQKTLLRAQDEVFEARRQSLLMRLNPDGASLQKYLRRFNIPERLARIEEEQAEIKEGLNRIPPTKLLAMVRSNRRDLASVASALNVIGDNVAKGGDVAQQLAELKEYVKELGRFATEQASWNSSINTAINKRNAEPCSPCVRRSR